MILSSIIAKVGMWLLGALGIIAGAWGLRHSGRVAERTETRIRAAERRGAALQTRMEIENAIDQDADLVARAARAGVVRHTER